MLVRKCYDGHSKERKGGILLQQWLQGRVYENDKMIEFGMG